MYGVIDLHRDRILDTIAQGETGQYRWLRVNRERAGEAEYQRRYRSYWAMNAARLSASFYTAYFDALKAAEIQNGTLKDLCKLLCVASVRQNGTQTIQFSFATKLQHTVNPVLPIYDSRVARFYLFQEPSSDMPQPARIDRFVAFNDFLVREYARVIGEGYLSRSIQSFRNRFDAANVTDEKIIDWIIWAFVGFADKGALLSGNIVYS